MCGIFCTINCKKEGCISIAKEPAEWTKCKDVIFARGPDSLNSIEKNLAELWYGHFYASVLWMQGLKPVSQPLVDTAGNILLWNGDIFSGKMFKENTCDSQIVLSALKDSIDIFSTLKEVKGPFSFIYFQKSKNLLYFARDKFGRHSLLFNINKDHSSIILTSVAVKSIKCIAELPAIGLFVADLNHNKIQFSCFPWYKPNERFLQILNDFRDQFNVDINIVKVEYLPKLENLFIDNRLNSEMGFLKYVKRANLYKTSDEIMGFLLKEESISQNVNKLHMLLTESVRRRVQIIPNFCRNCTKLNADPTLVCHHTKVGLLFSGGLDSAILTALANNHVAKTESIDLINVAFQKKKNSNYEVPDRITGRQTFDELLKIFPERKFNLIEVDVPREELEKYRSTRISNLVYPHATVLDDSLACAVWFASRGKGQLHSTKEPYESACRVLLLGMGADEQFGGYMRHRTILKNKGWDVLVKELRLEFDRISERNLGRDDRMVADHGRQSRLPYLDEDLVNFIQQLPPWERCCPLDVFPPGLGDKLLLRLLAKKINLSNAANFPKRAFQFGSRIADGKENAKDLSKRL